MKLGVLFSGGKDSCYALYKALEKEEVKCLINIRSQNPESYMFHTPALSVVPLQAEAAGIPLVIQGTQGVVEKELKDLETAIQKAVMDYGIEGVVTGAIESVYQATRVQRICHKLGLWCFNPLWQKDQVELLYELLKAGFRIVITGIFAEQFDEDWLGRVMDETTVKELLRLHKKHGISPSGEGGEIETTVLDAPFFKKRIEIQEAMRMVSRNSGVLEIKKACLMEKNNRAIKENGLQEDKD